METLFSESIRSSFYNAFIWVDIDTIITTVSLNFSSSTDVYTLEKEDVLALDEIVANCQ